MRPGVGMDHTIKIGGEAGQGIQTIGDALARVFARTGLSVFSHQDYESRIRGGHNFTQIRVADRPVAASRDGIDLLVALDRESIIRHRRELNPGGRILYDSRSLKQQHAGDAFLDVPFADMAHESGGGRIMANTVATGVVLGLLGLGEERLAGLLGEAFAEKGEAVVAANRRAARAGYAYAIEHCASCLAGAGPAILGRRKKLLLNGIEAIGLGALASGCAFYAAYPMTPSTGIMNYLAAHEQEYGIVVEQAEDEIAAVNMVLGASFAGVRAMTGTSGGGFALMTEGLSLAGMTETPIVIALGQRPGPATGFPTRTEQGELGFVLAAGHGEFPRVVFAPGSPRQAFHLTNKAFTLAEQYQIPVFLLFDTYLADSQWTFDGLDLGRLAHPDLRLRGEAFSRFPHYHRYAFTESGVSPLGVPGDASHLVVADSDEHDEAGHITEDGRMREQMIEKRLLRKMPLIRAAIAPPFLYGEHEPDTLLVGWGSTYGVLRETVDALAKKRKIALLHFSEVWPLPDRKPFDWVRALGAVRRTICVEQNATGQFERLLRAETGHVFSGRIHRYDGRPFTLETLAGEVDGFLGKR